MTALLRLLARLHDALEARHLARDCDCPSCVAVRRSRSLATWRTR